MESARHSYYRLERAARDARAGAWKDYPPVMRTVPFESNSLGTLAHAVCNVLVTIITAESQAAATPPFSQDTRSSQDKWTGRPEFGFQNFRISKPSSRF
jgi:hypothetical protein